jgi:hypothetical protein
MRAHEDHSNDTAFDGRDKWLALILGAVGFIVLLPGAFWGLPGGKGMVGALQILEGRIPYRDFWTMYAPGMFYLTALVSRVLGQEIVYQAVATHLLNASLATALFVVVRRLGLPRRRALVVGGVTILAFWATSPSITSYAPAVLALLLAILPVIRYHDGAGSRRLLVAGVWLGLAACFKHDIAAYIGTAIAISLWLPRESAGELRGSSWAASLRATAWLFAGTMVFFLPVASLVYVFAGADAWQDVILFPATDFSKVRGETYPPLLPHFYLLKQWLGDPTNPFAARSLVEHFSAWVLCHLPEIVFGVALVTVTGRWKRLAARTRALAVLFLSAMPFFWWAAHIQRNTHLYSMALMSVLLVSVFWRTATITSTGTRVALRIGVALYAAALLTAPVQSALRVAYEWQGSRTIDIPGTRWVRVPARQYEVYEPIAKFIREHTREDERIYVGVERHDAIVITDMRFHYLTGRLSCCRYSELHPGITDRLEVQHEIAEGIEAAGVRAAVIWKFGWPQERLDKIKARRMAAVDGVGESWLDDYIEANFEPLAQHGEYVLMWRRDALPPGDP